MVKKNYEKKTALVFTSLLKTWFKNSKNVLIGEWCLSNISNLKYKSYDFVISKKENEKIKIMKESKICNHYYERLLNDVTYNLEKYYNLKWNKRSWEVFFGPWLHRYVAIIFDRYYALDYVMQKFKFDQIKISKDRKYNLLTQDHKDFKIKSQTDEWNLKLFSKLFIKYFDNKKIKTKQINLAYKRYSVKKNDFYKLNFLQIYKNKFLKFFLKNLDNFTKKIYYKPYMGSKKTIILFNLLNKNIPFIYNFDHKLTEVNYINNIRNKRLKSKYELNKFEKVLRELFFEILPFYYLEQVNNLKYLRKELFLPNSNKRNVYTALGLYQENIFKFWLCEALSNNSKLFCIQHGNNYGTSKVLHSEYLERKLCDKFLTWGWNDKSKKIKKFSCTKLIDRNRFKRVSSKKIMVVGALPQAYRAEITTGNLFGMRSNIYIKILKKTFQLINKINFGNIYFRPYPQKIYKNYNLTNEIKDTFEGIKISDSKSDLLKTLEKFGLAVYLDDSTSFLETMALNKPTMIILSKELYFDHHRNSAVPFYKKLKKANILHDDPKALTKFIEKINFDFPQWWFSAKTQNIKNQFCTQYCNYIEKPLFELKKINF